MKLLMVAFAFAVVAAAQAQPGYQPFGTGDDYWYKNREWNHNGYNAYHHGNEYLSRAVDQYKQSSPDGSYAYGYKTDGNINFAREEGAFHPEGPNGKPILHVKGGYQYVAPNNEVITVEYTAGPHGYAPKIHTSGSYIPNYNRRYYPYNYQPLKSD